MDCNRYENLLLDDLYDEMDDITRAAAKKHLSTCAACSMLRERTLATKRTFALPSLAPSADLEAKIFAATDNAIREQQKVVPIRPAGRWILAAARWASRPQTAMAAVFMLMIGSGALLVRGKHETGADVVVSVSGRPSEEVDDPAATSTALVAAAPASTALVGAAPTSRGSLQGSSPAEEKARDDGLGSRPLGGASASGFADNAYAEPPQESAKNSRDSTGSAGRSYASPKVAETPGKLESAPAAPRAAKPTSKAAAVDEMSAPEAKGGAAYEKPPAPAPTVSLAKEQADLKKRTESLGCPASLPQLRSAVSAAPTDALVFQLAECLRETGATEEAKIYYRRLEKGSYASVAETRIREIEGGAGGGSNANVSRKKAVRVAPTQQQNVGNGKL